jgi:hypothetical protein
VEGGGDLTSEVADVRSVVNVDLSTGKLVRVGVKSSHVRAGADLTSEIGCCR